MPLRLCTSDELKAQYLCELVNKDKRKLCLKKRFMRPFLTLMFELSYGSEEWQLDFTIYGSARTTG
jgi:hypothetical protein